MHPQPEAFLRPVSLPSRGEAVSLRQERNPHRYPMTRLTRAHKAALFAALQGLLEMGKICSHRLLCTLQLHTPSYYETYIWLTQSPGEAGSAVSLLPPRQIWVNSSSLFLPNKWRCVSVWASMPRSSPWFGFLVSRLVVASGWWFSSLKFSNPLPPGCLPLGVFTSTSNTTCAKSFPSFSHEATLLLGFLTTSVALEAGNCELPFTSLTYSASFGIREQSQMPSGGAWACPESSGHCRCLPVWLHDKCLFGKLFCFWSYSILPYLINQSLALVFVYWTNTPITFTLHVWNLPGSPIRNLWLLSLSYAWRLKSTRQHNHLALASLAYLAWL